MKKNILFSLLALLFLGCQGVSVNSKKPSETGTTTGGGTSGGGVSGTGNTLPYTDSFNTDGILSSPWASTFSGDPIPTVTFGALTTSTSSSAYIPTLITTDVYSEIEFQHSPGITAYNFNLLNRYDHTNHSAVWCSFQLLSGSVVLNLYAMMNGNIMSYIPVTLPVGASDTNVHKAGCSVETNGPDVVLSAYLDPSANNTTPMGSFTLTGFDSILPSGSPGIVIEDNLNMLILDNFQVHSAFPY